MFFNLLHGNFIAIDTAGAHKGSGTTHFFQPLLITGNLYIANRFKASRQTGFLLEPTVEVTTIGEYVGTGLVTQQSRHNKARRVPGGARSQLVPFQ